MGQATLEEQASINTPAATRWSIAPRSDGSIYYKGNDGIERQIAQLTGGFTPVTEGGTGRGTGTTAYSLIATGTTATGAQQTLANGATTEILIGGGASALPVWTTATGSGAPVRATSPTLVTPALGTPTALVGTNITGTAAGLSIGGNAATATSATTATDTASKTGTGSTYATSASPTFTGTLSAAAITASGVITATGGIVSGNSVSAINNTTGNNALRIGVGVNQAGNAGAGWEFQHTTSTSTSSAAAYDRTGSAYQNMAFDALSHAFKVSGSPVLGVSSGAATVTGTLGASGAVTLSNLAGTGSRAVLADASGVLSAPISDASFKQNMRDLPATYGMQTILALRPKIFDFKDHDKYGPQNYLSFDAGETAGILPEVTGRMYDGDGDLVDTGKKDEKGNAIMRKPVGTYYISKEDIIPALVLHNQQMQAQIDVLTARLDAAGIK